MIALLISIFVSFGTFSSGTTTGTKPSPSSTPATVTVLGGTSTWTNGGVD